MRRQAIGLFAGSLLVAAMHAFPALADPRLTVVELFTAQGCAACPPADAYLGELAQRDDILALGFHVDYWDFIGWHDPYADPAYTRRQHRYADRLGIPYVFTPQIIVDGVRQGSGSNRGTIASYITAATGVEKPWVDIELIHSTDGRIHVTLPEMSYPGEAEVYLIRYSARHTTKVTRGENIGRALTNYNVVRQFQPIATWQGQALDLTIPLLESPGGGDSYAVIAQEPRTGRIVGATYIPK